MNDHAAAHNRVGSPQLRHSLHKAVRGAGPGDGQRRAVVQQTHLLRHTGGTAAVADSHKVSTRSQTAGIRHVTVRVHCTHSPHTVQEAMVYHEHLTTSLSDAHSVSLSVSLSAPVPSTSWCRRHQQCTQRVMTHDDTVTQGTQAWPSPRSTTATRSTRTLRPAPHTHVSHCLGSAVGLAAGGTSV